MLSENECLSTIHGNFIPECLNGNGNNFNVNKPWKDSLISHLYGTIEFLKNEIENKNSIIHSLLSMQSAKIKSSSEVVPSVVH